MDEKAYLVLENGEVFEGRRFGATGEALGELVFSTGMVGYLETLTDKSFRGQMLLQTFPLIGNYGVIPEDFEGDNVAVSAYIVKSWCQTPSNFRSESDLHTFLEAQNVVGLYDIDTRALTRMIRESGVMNGVIVDDPAHADLEAIAGHRIENAVAAVSRTTVRHELPVGKPKARLALMDFGMKEGIARELLKRGCELYIFPHDASVTSIMAVRPDGIMLSNGPGDPADNTEIIANLKELIATNIPIFGICLGHQLLALAHGFQTEKLRYGHRGGNQPVRDNDSGRVYITSQNHGYAVVTESINPEVANARYTNVNDGTNEGLDYINKAVFSVQFHPEASAGPHDTMFLFERFMNLLQEGSHATR